MLSYDIVEHAVLVTVFPQHELSVHHAIDVNNTCITLITTGKLTYSGSFNTIFLCFIYL